MGAAVLREWRGGISRQSRSRLPARAAPRCSVRAARCQRLRRLPDEVSTGEGDKFRTGTGGSTRRALLTIPAPHGTSRQRQASVSQSKRHQHASRIYPSFTSLQKNPSQNSRVNPCVHGGFFGTLEVSKKYSFFDSIVGKKQ